MAKQNRTELARRTVWHQVGEIDVKGSNVSRRGSMQRRVLEFLARAGEPQAGMDIAIGLRDGSVPVPSAFYSSFRRAAASLVRRGELRMGVPKFAPSGREHARAVYWLPDQQAPELKRLFPAHVVERIVLESVALGPLNNSNVVRRLAEVLECDGKERERLRMPVLRAIGRLSAAGKITIEKRTDGQGRPQKLIAIRK